MWALVDMGEGEGHFALLEKPRGAVCILTRLQTTTISARIAAGQEIMDLHPPALFRSSGCG